MGHLLLQITRLFLLLIYSVYLIFLYIMTRICYLLIYLFSTASHCTSGTMDLLLGIFLCTTLFLNLGVFINFIGASHYLSMGGLVEKYTTFRKRLTFFLIVITWINCVALLSLNFYTCSESFPKRDIYIHIPILIWECTNMLSIFIGTVFSGCKLLRLLASRFPAFHKSVKKELQCIIAI